jgi:predicted nucleic acid-binding protein
MNKILVDTNVLVYSIDEDSIYYDRSIKLLTNPKFDLYTTSKNISEFFTVLTKGVKAPVTIEQAIELLEGLLNYLTIIYPSKSSYQIFRRLLIKYKPKGLLIHDFEIASIGLQKGIDNIATINEKDFKNIEEIQLLDF